VVEDARGVMAKAHTDQYQGVYHVLGGVNSSMDGIGPADLNIEGRIDRVKRGDDNEVIVARSASREGDSTIAYRYRNWKDWRVQISTIARGIAFGGELEYVDEITLGRSIMTRVPYERHVG